ncbi:hypothetical protein MKW92_009196, partial [Papaver armeniacum]
MSSYIFRLITSAVIILMIHISSDKVTAQPSFAAQYRCLGDNYTNPSQFQVNLDKVLSSLTGNNLDKVYGILLCRGDITQETCRICAETAISELTERCPNTKEYITFYTYCMLRYSDRNIFSVMEEKPEITLHNRHINEGLARMATTNANHNETLLFAIGEIDYSPVNKIYGLVQCGIVLRPSCNIRYEPYHFSDYKQETNPGPLPSSPPPKLNVPATTRDTEKDNKSSSNIVLIVAIPLAIALVLISTALVYFYLKKKKKKKKKKKAYNSIDEPDDMDDITRIESLRFDLDTIKAATEISLMIISLGKEDLGTLSNGQAIAVKRLSINSEQGKKFRTEVGLLVKLQHRNLVRLLGFCLEEKKSYLSEFVPNGSLDQIIFGLEPLSIHFEPHESTNLNWETRYKIIGGIAKGLLDLKAANVLLDEENNAKISDFRYGKAVRLGPNSRK